MVLVIYTSSQNKNFHNYFSEMFGEDYTIIRQGNISKIVLGGNIKTYNFKLTKDLVSQLGKVYSFLARKINKDPISKYYLTIGEIDGITILKYRDLTIYLGIGLDELMKKLGNSKESYSMIPIKVKGKDKYIYVANALDIPRILKEIDEPKIIINEYLRFIGFGTGKISVKFRDDIVKTLPEYYKKNPKALKCLLEMLHIYNIPQKFGMELEDKLKNSLENILKTYMDKIKAIEQNPRLFLS